MGWPFVIVYILLIISAIYLAFVTAPNALNSNNWPQVIGQVTSSEIVKRKRTTKIGDAITVFTAKINYQYTVAGNRYTNHELMWADHNTDKHIQQSIDDTYPINSKVVVFHNPRKPNIAVLEQGLSVKLTLTALFLLASIALMAFALYRNASNRK